MFSAVVPSLVRVAVMGWLVVLSFCAGKFNAGGESDTTVAAPTRSITCGLMEALSTIDTAPFCIPLVSGAKVTVIEQFPPAGTLLGQVSVISNWPLALIEEMDKADAPLLVRVTVCGLLVVPMS